MNKFNYVDYPTVEFNKQRWYQITEEKAYPSITTILGQTLPSEKKKILDAWKQRVGDQKSKEVMKHATDRGSNVHLMCEQFLQGLPIDCPSATLNDQRLFNQIKLHFKKINEVYGQEIVLYSDLIGIAGRCDLVGVYDGKESIIDFKTSTYPKTEAMIQDYFIQETFYAIAHNEMFNTDITQIVTIMAVENGMPMVWKKPITNEYVNGLINRVDGFYDTMNQRFQT